ncbi:MAG: 3-oxoacyl-ACP synthase [Gemmatimonadetes bacterium]|nr:3-oxoacyl-ACP synthase [Gemmatimonadota bacterium]
MTAANVPASAGAGGAIPSVGIVSVGTYQPPGELTAADIAAASAIPEQVVVEKLGIKRKTVGSPDEHPNAMGVKAALDCLARSPVAAGDIDVVLCTTEEWKEYPVWTAGIDLAERIGATRAWAADVHMRCAGTVGAMKMARDMIRSDPEIRYVLIAGGYRIADLIDLGDTDTSFLFNIGAGAGAMLLARDWPRNEVLGAHVMVDGSLSRSVVVPVGGTLHPQGGGDPSAGFRLRLAEPEQMKARLNEVSMDNWVHCVDEALRKSGVRPDGQPWSRADLDYLNILLVKPSAHRDLLERLGLSEGQSVYLGEVGHIGEQDAMFSIREGLRTGRLRDGHLMAIVAAGIGYVWAAGIVRWGPRAPGGSVPEPPPPTEPKREGIP